MLLSILAFWWGYKKGRDSGRNALLWCLICGFSFIGTQLIVALGIGAFMGLGIAFWGWSESILTDYQLLITIVSVIVSIGTLLLIFRYLDRIPDEPMMTAPPPIFDTHDRQP